MILALNHGSLPIKPLKASKIEAKIEGALATIAQKRNVIIAELATAAPINITGNQNNTAVYAPGTKLYLVPEAAHQPWNKHVFTQGDIEFVLAPLSSVLAIEHAEPQ